MHKTAQSWFSGGPSSQTNIDLSKQTPSLVADWNAYAASSQSDQDLDSTGLGFDIESAVRTANDKVSGTFNVVSQGVRGIPGNLQSATSNVPSGQSFVTFGTLLAVGVFPVFIAVTVSTSHGACTIQTQVTTCNQWQWKQRKQKIVNGNGKVMLDRNNHAGKDKKDPTSWASIHKYHHKYVQTDRDPHSPSEGFWFSRIGWFCYNDYVVPKV